VRRDSALLGAAKFGAYVRRSAWRQGPLARGQPQLLRKRRGRRERPHRGQLADVAQRQRGARGAADQLAREGERARRSLRAGSCCARCVISQACLQFANTLLPRSGDSFILLRGGCDKHMPHYQAHAWR